MKTGEGQGQVFDRTNQPPVSIVTTLKEVLITAECDVAGGEIDRGIVLCEEHLEALEQGCFLCVYLSTGSKLYIRYEPSQPPRTW
ncbi:MAG: hypothetical protein ACYC3S_13365 [Chloroflexota bacterium]